MNYIELNIEFNELEPWREIVMVWLADKGAESFIETTVGFKAYFKNQNFCGLDSLELEKYKQKIAVINTIEIEDENWNKTWESNFDPVYIDNELAILAPFHNQNTTHNLKLTIQPQMSFGTGHHQTTALIAKRLLSCNVASKAVLDMGTGTGVLAILAEKLGSNYVFAPDIDKWAFENATENIQLNNCSKVEVALGGIASINNKKFDIIIANINKNILIDQFKYYAKAAKKGCQLLISGFFTTDTKILEIEAKKFGFIFENSYAKDEWALLEFIKIN